jgi:hypothetical protein
MRIEHRGSGITGHVEINIYPME